MALNRRTRRRCLRACRRFNVGAYIHQSCDCEDDDTEFEVLEIFNTRWGMTIYSDMDKDTLREARRLLDQMIHNTPSNTIH